jgi:NADPH:quinone reductase-like Zn-dependent oxidoreductase
MQAIVYEQYGSLDVLELKDVEKPAPREDEVLVKVYAATVTPGDAYLVKGEPFVARFWSGLLAPKHKIPGKEMAGRVEAVGGRVTQFRPGDEVFGDLSVCGMGAFAEYVCVPEKAIAQKPANLTFQEAAAVPESAVVALQGLRDKGKIQPGQKVLINGASGGVGTFAVQIAKSFGAECHGCMQHAQYGKGALPWGRSCD